MMMEMISGKNLLVLEILRRITALEWVGYEDLYNYLDLRLIWI